MLMRVEPRAPSPAVRRSTGEGKEHDPLEVFPVGAGPRLTTFRGGVIHYTQPIEAVVFKPSDHFAAVYLAPVPGMEAALGSDAMSRFDAPLGMLVVHPANVEGRARWPSPPENLLIGLRPSGLSELAQHELGTQDVELQPPRFGTVDRQALELAKLLRQELASDGTATELYTDALITIFGIHLLRHYSSAKGRRVRPVKGGLSSHQARQAREFLAENYSRKISISDVAAICGLSPRHFIRAFSATFKQAPHQYLVNLRLAAAEKLLVETDHQFSHIAYLSGFSSQSHMTATMRRYKSTTPGQIRKAK